MSSCSGASTDCVSCLSQTAVSNMEDARVALGSDSSFIVIGSFDVLVNGLNFQQGGHVTDDYTEAGGGYVGKCPRVEEGKLINRGYT